MVKITTGFIDVYTTAPKYADNMQRFINGRDRKEVKQIPFISDSSDSETSYFGDSSDEETTSVNGQNKNDRNNNINNNNEINRKMTRRQISCLEPGTNKINMLFSPKLSRKQISTSALDLSRSKPIAKKHHTADDASKLRLPLQQQRTGSQSDLSKYSSTSPIEEDALYQKNSYLLSPRIRRKQFDITKSPAYKEIYAHNLRLYSAVLAKVSFNLTI